MDWDIQRRSVLWRYGQLGLPNGTGYGNYASVVADLSVPPGLVYRHIWAFLFAVPDADSYPQWDASIIVTNGDTERRLCSWTSRANQGVLDVPGQSISADNESHIGFMPPFQVSQDLFGEPSIGCAIPPGKDARMFSFQVASKSSAQGDKPVFRCIAHPIDLTSGCRRIRLEVSNFGAQNSNPYNALIGNSGTTFTGWLAGGLQVKSQLRPL